MKKYLTTQEVAEMLSIQPRTIREWIVQADDPLPAIQLGKTYRVPEDEFLAWLERRRAVQGSTDRQPTG